MVRFLPLMFGNFPDRHARSTFTKIWPRASVLSQRCAMAKDEQSEHVCWICSQPVDLQTTKTDDRGRVVHEGCYAALCAHNSAIQSEIKVTNASKLENGE
jgi:hypothetical protein